MAAARGKRSTRNEKKALVRGKAAPKKAGKPVRKTGKAAVAKKRSSKKTASPAVKRKPKATARKTPATRTSAKKKLATRTSAKKKPVATTSAKKPRTTAKKKAAARKAIPPKKSVRKPAERKAPVRKGAAPKSARKKAPVQAGRPAKKSGLKTAKKVAKKAGRKPAQSTPKGKARPKKGSPKSAVKTKKTTRKGASVLKSPKPKSAAKTPPAAKAKGRAPRRRKEIPTGGAVASWIPSEEGSQPRSSSFIPAPVRVEAPSGAAAPPASTDRLRRPGELDEFKIRTFPVRVDIEQESGRTRVTAQPESLEIAPGEGLEWDFRYINGADLFIERVEVDFGGQSPFSKSAYKSKKPSVAKPHRLLSGPAKKSGDGKTFEYEVRCANVMGVDVATTRVSVTVSSEVNHEIPS